MKKKIYILVDIDHTISDAFHRDPMIGGEGGWDAYHAASEMDGPIVLMVDLINALVAQGYVPIALTARPAKWRQLTMNSLFKFGAQIEEILMRPTDGFHPAPEMKMALALERFGSEEEIRNQVAFILDDREDVCATFKAIGVMSLQVNAIAGGTK